MDFDTEYAIVVERAETALPLPCFGTDRPLRVTLIDRLPCRHAGKMRLRLRAILCAGATSTRMLGALAYGMREIPRGKPMLEIK